MTLFSAPHPLVPLATFSVGAERPAALEASPLLTCRTSPLFTPCSQPPVPLPLGQEVEHKLHLDGAVDTLPRYEMFPSKDQQSDLDAEFSLFGTEGLTPPVDPGVPPGLPEHESLNGGPDFLGRLQHMKTLFRMSATNEPVSMMIHRVGPLLILDNGPQGWSRGEAGHSQPLPPPGLDPPGLSDEQGALEADPQLMLAALEHLNASLFAASAGDALASSAEGALSGYPPQLKLPEAPISELAPRLCVKNTFLDVEEDEDHEELARTHTAPGRMGGASPATPRSDCEWTAEHILPLSPVVQRLQQYVGSCATLSSSSQAPPPGTESSSWSLMPYQPEASVSPRQATSTTSLAGEPSTELAKLFGSRQLAAYRTLDCRTLEAMRSLFSDIPPQPSRMGRAMEWRCGPYKILLGCDLVVFRSEDQVDVSKFASFKMLPPGAAPGPTREERLDVYLENLMCNINTAVWGSHHQGQTSWRVSNTQDLPVEGEEQERFDSEAVLDQGKRLLHFLRQKCRSEGGTYWLYREQNSQHAELFDLRYATERSPDTEKNHEKSPFETTESMVLPIASLCVHLAKAATNAADQRQLLQKAFSLLEPLKEEHPGLYSTVALQLACSYMRASLHAIPDSGVTAASSSAEPPAAARLSVALRYLEGLLSLLTSLDDDAQDEMADVVLRAELLLQAHVAYAECIVKLVREAFVPTYSGWLSEVQRSMQEGPQTQGPGRQAMIDEMKRLSAGFLIWRLFWLVRAQRALDFVPRDKCETECWVLERDLHETMGDALYGLSRYPADDADCLLAGQMGTSEGICSLVAEGLRSWGLRGGTHCLSRASAAASKASSKEKKNLPKGKKSSKHLVSPVSSDCESADAQPHNVNAMFLSKLNPLTRGFCDETLREDNLVREELRPSLWSEGVAFKTSLALFERAAARLRKAGKDSSYRSDEATLKIARKLAHLYNEEARTAIMHADTGTEGVEELLSQAHQWMLLSGDLSNASRVLLNLSELYARRAEVIAAAKGENGDPLPLSDPQYKLWLKAIECCEEAASLSENTLGRQEAAFAHLRVGVHLLTRVPLQLHLVDAGRREERLAELADRHFSKALRGFDELKDDREVAVCHFHMADLALQELRVPDAPPLPKARIISALRHARRSADYWERLGALPYSKDFISAHVRIARLLEHQQPKRSAGLQDALEHLSSVEGKLLCLARDSSPDKIGADKKLFVVDGENYVAVVSIRREMSRACQAGLRQGEDVDRLKKLYRLILRNEPLVTTVVSAT